MRGALVVVSVPVLAVTALSGCQRSPAPAPAARSVAQSVTPSPSVPAAAGAAAKFRSPRTYQSVALPVRVRIPAIGVDAPLEHLGLDADGTITAPHRWQDAGWYEGGPRPGERGPAVLLGHVDSRSGPAVFYRLKTLAPGAQVLVDRADGTTARFRVSGRLQVAKSQFPADLVYGPTLSPSLRLVTCGGTWDEHVGHYRDNVVVTALPEEGTP